MQKLLEYAALCRVLFLTSHQQESSESIWQDRLTADRVTDIEEIGGNGVIAKVDGVSVAAGNAKLMNHLGIAYIECHQCRNGCSYGY